MFKKVFGKTKDFLKFTWERIKERKIYLLIVILFFAYAIFMTKPFTNKTKTYTEYNVTTFWKASDEFWAGETVKQTFTANDNNLQCISVNALSLGRKLGSTIKAIVTEVETGREILNQDIPLITFKDGYLPINIENQPNSKGKEYSLELQSLDAVPGNGLVFWRALNDENTGEKYYENNVEIKDNRLMLSFSYFSSTVGNLYLLLWLLVFGLSIIFVIYFITDDADEITFLKVALCLGVFFIFMTPICHPYDESSHIFKATLIANGQPYVSLNEEGKIGGMVPSNYGDYLRAADLNFKNVIAGIENSNAFSKEKSFMILPYFSSTLPTGHAIPALGLFLGTLIRLPAIACLYIARICIFAYYISVTYLAIKNLKYNKSTFLVIALLPLSFWLSGTVSLDPIINASSFLFISICLKYFYMDKDEDGYIKIWELIALIVTAVMLITCKYLVYTPIVLLFFLIPKKRFKTTKAYVVMIVVSLIIGILTLAWQFWLLDKVPYIEDRNGHVDQGEQIEFTLNNIEVVVKALCNRAMELLPVYLVGFPYKTLVPVLPKSAGFLIVIAAILDKNKYTKDCKKKNIVSLSFICLYMLILFVSMYALYLSFTPVGASNVQGYQIRYIVPIMPLLMIPLSNMFNLKNETKNYNIMLTFMMFMLNVDLILALIRDMFV